MMSSTLDDESRHQHEATLDATRHAQQQDTSTPLPRFVTVLSSSPASYGYERQHDTRLTINIDERHDAQQHCDETTPSVHEPTMTNAMTNNTSYTDNTVD